MTCPQSTCWASSKPFSYYRDLAPHVGHLQNHFPITVTCPRRPTCWTSSKPFSSHRDLPPADILGIFKTIFLLPLPAPGRHVGHLQNHFPIIVTCPRPTCWTSSKPFSYHRDLPPADMLEKHQPITQTCIKQHKSTTDKGFKKPGLLNPVFS